jgi:hypothetical protein
LRLFQKIHDALHGGADGPPPLKALDPGQQAPVPVRTRMGTPADLAIVLDARAHRLQRGDDWRSSLTTLLALMDLADTPANRETLAHDLNLDIAGQDDAKAGAALHAALIQRLAENGAATTQDFYK